MKNQRGVTLVELLVIISIMGAIFAPISFLLIHSLETEKDVSAKNEVQREARLGMEYVSEQMRNKNTYWHDDGTYWMLSKYDFETSIWSTPPILTYDPIKKIMYRGTTSGTVLSENITFSTVPDPVKDTDQDVDGTLAVLKGQDILIRINKSGEDIELKSHIYFNRFK